MAGIALILGAILFVTIPSSRACGSVLAPGPMTLINPEMPILANTGCNGAQSAALRIAVVLGSAGTVTLLLANRTWRGSSSKTGLALDHKSNSTHQTSA